jgi:5-methylcytosine-specific restriction endonuclease McrA
MPIEELCVADTYRGRYYLKRRLVRAGLLEDRCAECGLSDWRGRPLALELHHVNGDGSDNRLENLAILCPNCHTQTDTWGGRNRRRAA